MKKDFMEEEVYNKKPVTEIHPVFLFYGKTKIIQGSLQILSIIIFFLWSFESSIDFYGIYSSELGEIYQIIYFVVLVAIWGSDIAGAVNYLRLIRADCSKKIKTFVALFLLGTMGEFWAKITFIDSGDIEISGILFKILLPFLSSLALSLSFLLLNRIFLGLTKELVIERKENFTFATRIAFVGGIFRMLFRIWILIYSLGYDVPILAYSNIIANGLIFISNFVFISALRKFQKK